jgi:hypothetical protein
MRWVHNPFIDDEEEDKEEDKGEEDEEEDKDEEDEDEDKNPGPGHVSTFLYFLSCILHPNRPGIHRRSSFVRGT